VPDRSNRDTDPESRDRDSHLRPRHTASTVTTYDIARGTVPASSGTTLATSTDDTRYTSTLTGTAPRGVLSKSWSQGVTIPAGILTPARPPSRPSPPRPAPARTIALFRALTSPELLTRVDIAGCETSARTQRAVLSNVYVTGLVIGSPALLDQTQFNYESIRVDRNDGTARAVTETFTWNVITNSP
jgi:hypothetical protein